MEALLAAFLVHGVENGGQGKGGGSGGGNVHSKMERWGDGKSHHGVFQMLAREFP